MHDFDPDYVNRCPSKVRCKETREGLLRLRLKYMADRFHIWDGSLFKHIEILTNNK